MGFMLLIGYTDFDLTGYSKIGVLSDYINEEPRTVQEIINSTNKQDIVLGAESEPTNWEDYYRVAPRDAICSNSLNSTVEGLESKGYELYTGEMFGRSKVNSKTFLAYLQNKNIKCIIPTFYTGFQGEEIPMIQTFEDSEYGSKNIFLYRSNQLKTIWYFIFGTYFSNSIYLYPGIWFYTIIPALLLILIYYKVILYIIFGSKKK
jgi:hypothetical protein